MVSLRFSLCKVPQLQSDKSWVQEPDLFWSPGSSFLYCIMFSTQELFDFDLKRVFLQLLSIHPCLILCPHKGNSDLTLPTRLMISADISPTPPSALSAHCTFTAHLFSHHFGQPLWVHSSCLCPSAYVVPGVELKRQDQGGFPIVHVLVIVPAESGKAAIPAAIAFMISCRLTML